MFIHISAYLCVHIYTSSQMCYLYVYIDMNTYMYMSTYIFTYIFIHIFIHTSKYIFAHHLKFPDFGSICFESMHSCSKFSCESMYYVCVYCTACVYLWLRRMLTVWLSWENNLRTSIASQHCIMCVCLDSCGRTTRLLGLPQSCAEKPSTPPCSPSSRRTINATWMALPHPTMWLWSPNTIRCDDTLEQTLQHSAT